MSDELKKQKAEHPDSDSSDFEFDMNKARTMFAAQSAGPSGARKDANGETIDDSLLRFESQDGTVDRCFHFIMKLFYANPKAPSNKTGKTTLALGRRTRESIQTIERCHL